MFEDKAINQHYISQVEQKLNAIDPTATKPKIYEFAVLDRTESILKDPRKVKIGRTLSADDLFSFDIGWRTRKNFESLFKRYERNI